MDSKKNLQNKFSPSNTSQAQTFVVTNKVPADFSSCAFLPFDVSCLKDQKSRGQGTKVHEVESSRNLKLLSTTRYYYLSANRFLKWTIQKTFGLLF